MQHIPLCITKVEVINSHVQFSCYSFSHISLTQFFNFLILIFPFIIIFFIGIFFLIFLLLFLRLKRQLLEKYVLLEIIPPSDTKQTILTTEQFMTSLYGLGQQRSFFDKIIGRENIFSLELVATKEKGIRYIVKTPEQFLSAITRQLLSFLPGATILETIDYFQEKRSNKYSAVKELKLTKPFVYSLQEQSLLSQHDPIAYITGHMTKLEKHDMVVAQFILTPVTKPTHPHIFSFTKKLLHLIANGEDVISMINNHHTFPINMLYYIILSVLFILFSPFTIIMQLLMPSKNGDLLPFWLFGKEEKNLSKQLNPEKQAMVENIREKIQKELFETSIRIFVTQENFETTQSRMQGIISSFQPLHTHLQKLQPKFLFPIFRPLALFFLRHRLLALKNNPILSVSELANLYHFPYTPITHTEDLVQSKNQELPVPLSVKNNSNLSVVFAKNTYGGVVTQVGQNILQRRKHTYIIGGTGTGKTTLIYSMIMQDIIAGNGITVIDPHGDLIQKILLTFPKDRKNDVVFINPDDTDNPMGCNILELPKDLSKDELQKYKDQLTGILIATFQKLFPPRAAAYRMEHILRQAIVTVLETENPTLFTIQKLLTDYQYRKQIVEKLKDPILINFWKKEFASMGSMQRSDAISPITTRLGEFFSSHMARNILLQKYSTINFADSMNNKKILLCDLSKGKITESMSSFFGALITAQIELAALQRARISEKNRVDFYVYIDEFQNFATASFTNMMSESRKYHVYTILAHQGIAQIEDKNFIDIVLTNTGTVISFHTGSPLDEKYILPFFTPEVKTGQLHSLPPYNFYIKITDTNPSIAFTGQTEQQNIPENLEIAEDIKELSRQKYTQPKETVEKELAEMFETQEVKQNKQTTKTQLKKAKEHHLGKNNEKK